MPAEACMETWAITIIHGIYLLATMTMVMITIVGIDMVMGEDMGTTTIGTTISTKNVIMIMDITMASVIAVIMQIVIATMIEVMVMTEVVIQIGIV
jgi:hypothetical protein